MKLGRPDPGWGEDVGMWLSFAGLVERLTSISGILTITGRAVGDSGEVNHFQHSTSVNCDENDRIDGTPTYMVPVISY